jgi:iron complex outermembrane receptor protein
MSRNGTPARNTAESNRPVGTQRRHPAPPPLLVIGVTLVATLGMQASGADAADLLIRFDIPTQSLNQALLAFAKQSGRQVLYRTDIAANIKSRELQGSHTPEEALRILLGDAPLQAVTTGDGAITLEAREKPVPQESKAPADPVALPAVKVTAEAAGDDEDPENGSLTTPSIAQSREVLERVPGGTTLIEGKRIKEGAAYTVNDAFAYTPGVYVGDNSGSVAGGSRISIRGSNVVTSMSPIRGIKFLRDGLPFTDANGETDTETLNLYPIHHIEVYRGAQALQYGASNLGGAINFVTPTGYTADRLKVGMILGTNGYVNPTVSGGGVLGHGWDAYGSFSHVDFNGIRDHSDQELFYGYGNIGYRWNENQETRLHVDIQNIDYQTWPSPLTKRQLKQDPHQNPTTSIPKNGFPVYKFDLRHTVRLDDGDRFDFGAYYFNKDFSFSDAQWGFYRDLWQDAGFSWRHQINGQLFGLQNRVVWGGLTQWMWINDHENDAVNGSKGPFRFNERDDWNNVEAFLEDQFSLTDRFTLVLGGQVNYRKAAFEHRFPPLPEGEPSRGDQDFFNFNPKLGFTWQAMPQMQLYGNISRSAEPPPLSNLADVQQTPKLVSQTGTTVEIGTRGAVDWLQWDLAFYHAWLNNELLIVPIPPNFINFTTTNAGNTQHTGIELGLEGIVPLGLIASDDHIRLRGSYTWSRFQFDGDPVLDDNRLPGIPEHNARFEALYQHPDGFYVGPNVQAVSSNWADFTNTLAADAYAILGARVGWDDGKHWKVFVDGRNLTNERYAASVIVTGDAGGQDAAQFSPGATRMVFGGFEYRF